jgi:hypothetical protein
MINKVYEILKATNLPLDHNFRPDFDVKGIVISYHFFNEGGMQFGDGEAIQYGGALQVDLFAKHGIDFTSTKKQVKEILTSNGFKLETINTDSDNVDGIGNIDHIIFILNYLESEVIGNGTSN